MNSEDSTGEDRKKGYTSMLKVVEDLIGKEGKNIKEAIDIAEQKLSEWGSLGREEINKISDEVQHDLGSLGETVEAAKASFHEKWEIDSKYLSDATWKKLSDVADKTTVALMEFKEELQERVEEATKDLHEREHKDHRAWHSDHEMWLDEVNIWEKEYAEAEESLKSIQDQIDSRKEQLAQHAKAIATLEYIDKVHEKDIARSEQDPDNPVLDVINSQNQESYEEMKERHKEEASIHRRLKADHREFITLVAKLKKLGNGD